MVSSFTIFQDSDNRSIVSISKCIFCIVYNLAVLRYHAWLLSLYLKNICRVQPFAEKIISKIKWIEPFKLGCLFALSVTFILKVYKINVTYFFQFRRIRIQCGKCFTNCVMTRTHLGPWLKTLNSFTS